MNRDRIKVDVQTLIHALEDNDRMGDYYLNLKTGRVEFISMNYLPEQEEIKAELEDNSDDFQEILPFPSSKSFQIMVDFAEQLKEEKVKRTLLRLLNQKKPFSKFKNALYEYPEIRERWFTYHHKKMKDLQEGKNSFQKWNSF